MTRYTVTVAAAAEGRIAQRSDVANPHIHVPGPGRVEIPGGLVNGDSVVTVDQSESRWVVGCGKTELNARFCVANIWPDRRLLAVPFGDIRVGCGEVLV